MIRTLKMKRSDSNAMAHLYRRNWNGFLLSSTCFYAFIDFPLAFLYETACALSRADKDGYREGTKTGGSGQCKKQRKMTRNLDKGRIHASESQSAVTTPSALRREGWVIFKPGTQPRLHETKPATGVLSRTNFFLHF